MTNQTHHSMLFSAIPPEIYTLTRDELYVQLLIAHYSARKNKSTKPYVAEFEADLEANLNQLCDDLYYRRYRPLPSTRFIVTFPKPREIYAANYRDRIVHHLIYNMTHALFERTFIYDTYSCIEGRGTHFGIERFASINSTLGVLSHYDSYNIRKSLTQRYHPLYCGFAHCNADRTKLIMNDV